MTAQIIDFVQKRREHYDKVRDKLLDTDIRKLDKKGYEKFMADLKKYISQETDYYT